MIKEYTQYWHWFAMTWALSFGGIAIVLFEDITGTHASSVFSMMLMTPCLLVMMTGVCMLQVKKVPKIKMYTGWFAPSMLIWTIFVFVRAIVCSCLGRSL